MGDRMKWAFGAACFLLLLLWSILWFVGSQATNERIVRLQQIQAGVCAKQNDPGNCIRVANGYSPVKP